MSFSREDKDDEIEDLSHSHHHDVSLTFYQWNLVATLTWWVLVKGTTGKHVHQVTSGAVVTCPSWLPRDILHRLQSPFTRIFIFLFYLVAQLLLVVGVFPNTVMFRIVVALSVSLYHLVESSATHRHGEYPLLYNAWAMCCSNQEHARAASWGIAIHFVLSTGVAKVVIGGGRHWMSPSTMKFYLTAYHEAKLSLSRPWSPSLNRWICQRDWATSLIAAATLVLECVMIPVTLLLPPHQHWVGSLGMMLMHVGIFAIMSKKVGLVFCTTLPCYILGFRCSAPLGTPSWWIATAIGLGPTTLSLIGGVVKGGGGGTLLLPEDWPLSPVSLFMWSGEQAKTLTETLMTRDTRVVLGTDNKTAETILGLSVVHHGAVASIAGIAGDEKGVVHIPVVHDCILRVIGFTLLQGDLITVTPKPPGQQQREEWKVGPFVKSVQDFLESKRRLFETQSGRLLTKAFLVKIDSKGNVAKVLVAG